jgi:site-specific recombinase XerD
MSVKEILTQRLLNNKPKLSESSLRTYASLLSSFFNRFGKGDVLKFYDKHEKVVLKNMKDRKTSSRKTFLSAYYVLSGLPETYKQMIADAKTVNDNYKTNAKSEKEAMNWLTVDEITETYDKLKDRAEEIVKQKVIRSSDVFEVRDFILLDSFVVQSPRRSMDYTSIMINNVDKEKMNYIDNKGNFCFNKYKTAKFYGLEKVSIDQGFLKFLKKYWINKLNKTDYFLIDDNLKPLTSAKVTKIFNRIFGKKASTNMLRHSFVTSLLKDVPKISELEETAKELGHSVGTLLTYNRKD